MQCMCYTLDQTTTEFSDYTVGSSDKGQSKIFRARLSLIHCLGSKPCVHTRIAEK